jgi:hypothetical protein
MHAGHFTRWGLLGTLALLGGACNSLQDGNGPYPYQNRATGYTHKVPRYAPGNPRYNVTGQQSPSSVDPMNPRPATTTGMAQGTGGSGDMPAVMMRKDPTGGTGAGGSTASDPATWRPRETSAEFVLQAPDGSFKQNNHTGGAAPLIGTPAQPVPAPPPGNTPQALQRGSQDLGPERLPTGIGGSGATGPSQPETGAGAPGTGTPHSDTGGSMKEPAEKTDKPNTTGNTTGEQDKESVKP